MEEWYHYVLLIVVGFAVGFINTIAGGGSLLSLPVLIFLGLPPSVANGTNRIAIVIQTAKCGNTSTLKSTIFALSLVLATIVGAIGLFLMPQLLGESRHNYLQFTQKLVKY